MDTGDVHWPGLDVLKIFSKSDQDPGRSFPGSAGITTLPEVCDTMDTEPGKVSPKAGVESMRLGFIYMAPGNVTDPWLFMLTSTNSALQQFSNSTPGNGPLSNDSGIHSFYTATLLGPSLSQTIRPERVGLYQTISFHVLCDYQACMPGCWVIQYSKCGLRDTRQTRWVLILRRHMWVLGTDSGMCAFSNWTQSGYKWVIQSLSKR